MYSLGQLRRGIKRGVQNPSLFLREVNRVYFALTKGGLFNKEGVDIFKEDWDTLIILDGCRYDIFADTEYFPGKLERRISRGSHTSQFIYGNFHQRELLDTVYTTASPQLKRRSINGEVDATFHAVYNVWDTDRWDEDEGTVLPDDMVEAAIEILNKHPNKRHIFHFIQPHYPFIDSDIDDEFRTITREEKTQLDIWEALFSGDVQLEPADIWEAYQGNLQIAISEVNKLLDYELGKTAVTSDHGNMIKERSFPLPVTEWGHPIGIYTPELVNVPWKVINSENRRDITSGEAHKEETVDENVVEKRLQDLGYV